jgi:glycosyltransferase involved in cell wall biosynthesis
LPYALLDAMFAELPIVGTDVGGVREALGEAGLVVAPGDPVALVEALGTLLEMRDSARRFGQHARERALKLFTEERWVEAYRASYDRLTGRAVKPEPAVAEIRRTAGERRSYRREAARLRA